MTSIQSSARGAHLVQAALASGLALEFGGVVADALAARFLDAEEADFHWDARVSERWLGCWECDADSGEVELDRVAILGKLDGRWFTAQCIVDGEGAPHGLLACRRFARARDARRAYADAR